METENKRTIGKKWQQKILDYLSGTSEENRKTIDDWLLNSTHSDYSAMAETMWLSDGEIWVYMWYCGWGCNKKFLELPYRWQREIFNDMVLTKRISK